MLEDKSDNIKELIKKGEVLFGEGKISEAEHLFMKLLDVSPEKSELFNNLGVIKLSEGDLISAENFFKSSLDINKANKDAIQNYSTLLKQKNRIFEISPLLDEALSILPEDKELLKLRDEVLESKPSLPRLAVICAPGLTSFINDIVDFLKIKYEVRTCYSNNNDEIETAVKWADTLWLEWANELTIHVTNNIQSVSEKKVICRIHSYEVLSGYLNKIDWSKISRTIFVADHILKIALEICPAVSQTNPSIIYNGLDMNKFPYNKRGPGFNIGIVGYINHKKNPAMWIEILSRLVKIDNRYNMHIAGSIQELRYGYYLNNIVTRLGLRDNIHFHGKVDDISSWYNTNNINYLLTTSVFESFGYVIAEAMAMGCRPLINAFPGAEEIWPEYFIFGCIDELIEQIHDNKNYNSKKYRDFVESKYSLKSQLSKIDNLVDEIMGLSIAGNKINQVNSEGREYNQQNINPILKEYHRPEKTVIVTGIPRSGTSLFSTLLNSFHNATCLNEILYDVDSLPSSFAEIRRRIISGEPIPNRYDRSGNLTTDTQGNGADVLEKTIRKGDWNTVIGSKINIPYLNNIEKIINYEYKVIAIVRDPVYAIGSWNSSKAINIPEAHITDDDMHPRWSNFKFFTNDKIERQAQIWNFYSSLIWNFRNHLKIYTYELLASDLEWVINDLSEFLGLEPPKNTLEITNQNIDSKYPNIDEIKEAVRRFCPMKSVFTTSHIKR